MKGGERVDVLPDRGDGGRVKDCRVVELGYKKRVRRWGWLG